MANEINVQQLNEILANLKTEQTQNTESKPEVPNTELADALSHPKKLTQQAKTNTKGNKYKLGHRRNNTRYIGTDSIQGGKLNFQIRNGRIVATPNSGPVTSHSSADGYIGDSNQYHRGDCYFLAELNAIRNTKGGQKLLQQNCKLNPDGSYTITMPGAKKIREEYKKRGLPCDVTGTYTISKEAMEKARKSDKYSKGDMDVVAYEIAMEAYRAEMFLTVRKNGKGDFKTAEGNVTFSSFGKNGDVLSSGQCYDAGFILTGQKSNVFRATNKRYNKVKPYTDGKYGYITREQMAKRTGADISMYKSKGLVRTGVSEVNHYTQNEQAINSMLNQYEGKEGEYALSVSVRVAKKGPDGVTQAGGGHALTIMKITGDTVYVANPWHPNKIEPIPRTEFIKMTTGMSAMPVKKSPTTNNHHNGQTSSTTFSLSNIMNLIKRKK